MRRDVTGNSGSSKPLNHAGLYLVARKRNHSKRASRTSPQDATGIMPRHLCWTALGTFLVGGLCLLIK
jgi:hypothetical protein